MEQIRSARTLCIKAKHVGKYVDIPGRPKKGAVGIYTGVLLSSPDVLFWGWRWISNTEGLFAACIDEGLNELFPESETPELDVVVKNDGFKKYLEEYVPGWLSRGGRTSEGHVPDQYEHWRRVYELYQISRVRISKEMTVEVKSALHNLSTYCDLVGPIALRILGGKFDANPEDWSGDADAFNRWLNDVAGLA